MVLDSIVLGSLKTLVEMYEKYQIRKANTHRQKMFDLTMINLYMLGEKGKGSVPEEYLNDIRGLSKMDLFKSVREAIGDGLVIDASSHNGRGWMLNQDGIMYTEALLDQIKK